MNKKILVSLSIILFTIFSFTICQATDDVMKGATNNIRNFVGGVEKMLHEQVQILPLLQECLKLLGLGLY